MLRFFFRTEHRSKTERQIDNDLKKWFQDIQKALTLEDHSNTFQSLRVQFENRYPALCTLGDKDSPEVEGTIRRRWLRQLRLRLALDHEMLPPAIVVKVTVNDRANIDTTGGFADIFQAVQVDRLVALKRPRVFQNMDRENQRRFYQECLAWWNLSHPHVLPLLGVSYELFSTTNVPCIVTPWMEKGNIRQVINVLVESQTQILKLADDIHRWLGHIILGLSYLHSEGIIHGDLRGVNILVDNNNSACLADFGLSAFSEITSKQFATAIGGASPWLPPEHFDPQAFGFKSDRQRFEGDIYAFACVCIELYTGKDPWCGKSPFKVPQLVLNKERPARPKFHKQLEMEDRLWDIIQACWNHKPSERPTADRLVTMIGMGDGVEKDANERIRDNRYHSETQAPSSISSAASRWMNSFFIKPPASLGFQSSLSRTSASSYSRPYRESATPPLSDLPNLTQSLPNASSEITHGTPFASRPYVTPSGAPGFAGDRTWNTGNWEFEFNKENVGKKSIHLSGRNEMTTAVLTVDLADRLRPYFPPLARLPRSWTLLYSLDQHGISLNTLYAQCDVHNGHVVVVMKDSDEGVFGAFIGEGLHPSKGRGYYESGESFLWKLAHNDKLNLKVFKWTGKNDYVALCESNYLSFGGGNGHYGLYLDDTLSDGSSAPCPTFNNDPLCSPGPKQGGGYTFECVGLEVWGVES